MSIVDEVIAAMEKPRKKDSQETMKAALGIGSKTGKPSYEFILKPKKENRDGN